MKLCFCARSNPRFSSIGFCLLMPNSIMRWLLGACLVVGGSAISLSIARSGGNASSPYQYGIMFEDINNSGDGGIYAELIRNRAFQGSSVFPATVDPWTAVGGANLTLQNTSVPLSSALPTSLHVTAPSSAKGKTIGIENPGWWGIAVEEQKYTGSFHTLGKYSGTIAAKLRSNITGTVFATTKVHVESNSRSWTGHTFNLHPSKSASNSNNTLILEWTSQGESLNFNLISLFPPTYNNRRNGNRIELMQALKDLNPSFFRIPGGNNLQGRQPGNYWAWNNTLGPLVQRPGLAGSWGYEQTNGLGLIEYMLVSIDPERWRTEAHREQWAKDLKMTPILAVFAGLYLDGTILTAEELRPFVQYALNELEFLMGDSSTHYGRLRISLGFPKPFKITMVEVGNEDENKGGLASYNSYRFRMFYDAIKAKYPKMYVIPSYPSTVLANPKPGDSGGDYHQYPDADTFVEEFGLFDHQNLTNKVLVGEYAVRTTSNGTRPNYPHWQGTVGEAVFLIGTERNTDRVIGTSYAPLLQNLNFWQWVPDLISFTADPKQTVLSTSYQLVKLFSNNRFTRTLPVKADAGFGPAYWVAGVDEKSGSRIVKMAVYNATSDVPVTVSLGSLKVGTKARLIVLTADDPLAQNVLDGPEVVKTTTSTLNAGSKGFSFKLPNLSIALLKIP